MLTADALLETVAVPQLAIVGESHADPFYGALVRDPATGKPLATASVTHIPVFKTDEFLDGQGHLHLRVVLALAALRLLLYCAPDKDDAIPTAFVPPNLLSPPWGMAWRASPFLKRTPLLFVVGEINARQTYQAIPQHADVLVPFTAEALAGVPGFAATAQVHAESLESAIHAQLAPMFAALERLHALGLGPIALHSISPCTADDDVYRAELVYDTRALTRTKIIMLFNAALRHFCARNGFVFIDRWDELTDGGRARDGVLADVVHTKPELMLRSLTMLYERTLGAV